MKNRAIAPGKVVPIHDSGYTAPFILSYAGEKEVAAKEVMKTHSLARFDQWSFRVYPNAIKSKRSVTK